MHSPLCDSHLQVAVVQRDQEVQTSRRKVPPKRSHTEFARGARTGVRNTRTPSAVTPLSSSWEKMLSRSWITNRYGWSPGSASRNCCNVHSAVGWAVTL